MKSGFKGNGSPADLPPVWAETLLQMQRSTIELIARMDRRSEEDRGRAEEGRKRAVEDRKRAEEDRKFARDDRRKYEEDRLWFREFIQEMRVENRRREKEFARVLITVGKVGGRILNTLDRIEGKLDGIAKELRRHRRDNGGNGQERGPSKRRNS